MVSELSGPICLRVHRLCKKLTQAATASKSDELDLVPRSLTLELNRFLLFPMCVLFCVCRQCSPRSRNVYPEEDSSKPCHHI